MSWEKGIFNEEAKKLFCPVIKTKCMGKGCMFFKYFTDYKCGNVEGELWNCIITSFMTYIVYGGKK